MRRSVGDQRDEISLKGDYEFKENKNRENGQGEKREQAVEKREDVDHREDVDLHRARTKMSSQPTARWTGFLASPRARAQCKPGTRLRRSKAIGEHRRHG